MGETNYQILIKNEPYFAGYTRVFMALIAAVLLIWLSAGQPLLQLVLLKRFYYSLIFGFFLAIVVLESIHWANVLLDRYCSWESHRNRRFAAQLLLGVGAVLYLDVMLVRGIYYLIEQDFEKGGFMKNIFPTVILLVLLVNVLYFFRRYHNRLFDAKRFYRLLRGSSKGSEPFTYAEVVGEEPIGHHPLKKVRKAPQQSIGTVLQQALLDTVDQPPPKKYWKTIDGYIQSNRFVLLIDEILCIKTGSIYGDIYLKSGRICNMHLRGKELREHLDPMHFVEIRSGMFLALDAIDSFQKRDRKIRIILKPEFEHLLENTMCSKKFHKHFQTSFYSYKNYIGTIGADLQRDGGQLPQ